MQYLLLVLMWLYIDTDQTSDQCIVVGFYKLNVNEILILYQSGKLKFTSKMNHKSLRVISLWTQTSLIDWLIILGHSQELWGEILTLESTGM